MSNDQYRKWDAYNVDVEEDKIEVKPFQSQNPNTFVYINIYRA